MDSAPRTALAQPFEPSGRRRAAAPTTSGWTLRDYYAFSLRVGLLGLSRHFLRDALARLLNPLSYPRLLEFTLVTNALGLTSSSAIAVLDVGSPKLLGLLIADRTECPVTLTDIRPYFISSCGHFLRRLGHGPELGHRVQLQVADARALPFPDSSFDRIFSVSVLEHIPNDGDSAAMREFARVLRPGGMVSVTVPYSHRGFYEKHVERNVYERRHDGGDKLFYQRHYDGDALSGRLQASDLELVDLVLFGERGIRFEPWWNRIPIRYKVPLLWAQPLIASALLGPLSERQEDAACGACLTFRRLP